MTHWTVSEMHEVAEHSPGGAEEGGHVRQLFLTRPSSPGFSRFTRGKAARRGALAASLLRMLSRQRSRRSILRGLGAVFGLNKALLGSRGA